MPIYEYHCADCNKQVSLLFLSFRQAQEETARCPACGRERLTRLVSRFATVRSASREGPAADSGDVPDLEGGDPRQVARWMRQMSAEAGEPMEPEMGRILDRLESGEDPERIGEEMEGQFGDEAPAGGGLPDTGVGAAGDESS